MIRNLAILLALACAGGAAQAQQMLDDVVIEAADTPGRQARKLAPAAPAADGKYEVDLLLLYTQPVLDAMGGLEPARAEARQRVAVANQYFDNSLIRVRYRLVGVERYPDGVEPGVPSQLADLPSVAALRNSVGADLVSVLRSATTTACGQAMTFNGGMLAQGAEPDNVDPERDAFSVVFCLEGRTFAHELGHNLGAGHDYTFSGQTNPVNHQPIPVYAAVVGNGYWRSYAHGWRCGNGQLPGAKYCDIMHYCRTPDAMYENLLGDFFSNPLLVRDGEPCGADGPVEAQQADNARSIMEAAPYVAAYREPADAASRAVAGTGGALPWHWLLLAAGLLRVRGVTRRPKAVSAAI